MDTNVDIEENQISFTTNHFSEYIIVDISTWKAAWEQESIKIRNKDSKFEIAFVIDDSGSMTSNDGENKRLEATKEFVKELEENDSYSVVKFVDSAEEVLGLTTDKSKLSDALKSFSSSGGTNIGSGLVKGLEVLKENNNNTKVIVLLTDGEDGVATDTKEKVIKEAKDRGITIFAIFLTSSENVASAVKNVDVQDISTSTGGYYYTIESSKMAEVFNRIHHISVGIDLDGEDSDGDGLPDDLELGGIKNQFGQIIYTNPYSDDTDRDGKSDKEEVGNLITDHYEMKSDPNTKTTLFNGKIKWDTYSDNFGPSLVADSSKVWDSKFNMYKNAFQFKNLDVNKNNGVCTGIAYVVEQTFNKDKLDMKIDNPKIIVREESFLIQKPDDVPASMEELKTFVEETKSDYLYIHRVMNASDLEEKNFKKEDHFYIVDTEEEFKAIFDMEQEELDEYLNKKVIIISNNFIGFNVESKEIENGLLRFYYPKGDKLKTGMNTEANCPEYTYDELKKDNDKELINMLYYYWREYNNEIFISQHNTEIDYDTPITEDGINELKRIFSIDNKVVSVIIPGHQIIGYALEEISNDVYKLYVYDSNFPIGVKENRFILIQKNPNTDKYEIGIDGYYKKDDNTGSGIDEIKEKNENGEEIKRKVFKLEIVQDGKILNYPEK